MRLTVYIGFDSKEPLAFAVAAHSILRRASRPIAIVPLALSSLQKVYTRERGPTESTEFSLTRFLVPFLSNYDGISLFLVDPATAGVETERTLMVDAHNAARITLTDVAVDADAVIGAVGGGEALLDGALNLGRACAASSAVRMAPMRPSIMSLGATMSTPASAWVSAWPVRISTVSSLRM